MAATRLITGVYEFTDTDFLKIVDTLTLYFLKMTFCVFLLGTLFKLRFIILLKQSFFVIQRVKL